MNIPESGSVKSVVVVAPTTGLSFLTSPYAIFSASVIGSSRKISEALFCCYIKSAVVSGTSGKTVAPELSSSNIAARLCCSKDVVFETNINSRVMENWSNFD